MWYAACCKVLNHLRQKLKLLKKFVVLIVWERLSRLKFQNILKVAIRIRIFKEWGFTEFLLNIPYCYKVSIWTSWYFTNILNWFSEFTQIVYFVLVFYSILRRFQYWRNKIYFIHFVNFFICGFSRQRDTFMWISLNWRQTNCHVSLLHII